MPTIFTHAVAAAALGQSQAGRRLPAGFWVWTIACAIVPDADVVGFLFGVRYGDMLGHRGFSHSLCFAAVVGGAVALRLTRGERPGRRVALAGYFSAVTASHPLLDAMTDGGLGVALFAPFSGTRYFLPWRPIEVSPIGLSFFSVRGLDVLSSELRWVWLPALAVIVLGWATRRGLGRVWKTVPTD